MFIKSFYINKTRIYLCISPSTNFVRHFMTSCTCNFLSHSVTLRVLMLPQIADREPMNLLFETKSLQCYWLTYSCYRIVVQRHGPC